MRTITLLAIIATTLNVAAQDEGKWQKIENRSFSFSVPASFKKTDVEGIDSFVEEYVADGIELSFDFGEYANNFSGWPNNTKYENLKIDGKAVRVGTAKWERNKGFSYSTQVHIRLDQETALSMFAACKSEKELAVARKIFDTIAFKRK